VRLSGQDSGRGTFSQRHAVLYDTQTGRAWAPLAELRSESNPDARFDVYDSSLSEEGVLGFEYGYSVIAQHALVLWEAQFGDFGNGAQTIIDQYIAASEDKWKQRSRLVMLLPHGSKARDRNTRARDSSDTCNFARKIIYRFVIRRHRRSTFTCCDDRCGQEWSDRSSS